MGWKPGMLGTGSGCRTRERPLDAECNQFRADAAAAHERLGMALSLVGQIQADAEREKGAPDRRDQDSASESRAGPRRCAGGARPVPGRARRPWWRRILR